MGGIFDMRNHGMFRMAGLVIVAFICSCSKPDADFTNPIGMQMIRVESGSFMMGNNDTLPDRVTGTSYLKRGNWDERPVHEVVISEDFYISSTEVTVEQYRKFRPDYAGIAGEDMYVAGVSWHDAQEFCEWLSAQEGVEYRLPTEAEWEFAARAGKDLVFGESDTRPEPGAPNSLGIKNMHTGVREWCSDWYGAYPLGKRTDPVGPETGLTKVVRGGGLDSDSDFYARSANRAAMAPAFRFYPEGGQTVEVQRYDEKSSTTRNNHGLGGTMFGQSNFTDPRDQVVLDEFSQDWRAGFDGEMSWSMQLRGAIESPATGRVTFSAEVDDHLRLEIGGKTVMEGSSEPEGSIDLEQGKSYPVQLSFSQGGGGYLTLYWSWDDQGRTIIPASAFSHSAGDIAATRLAPQPVGAHPIGFRVVQAQMPETDPLPYRAPEVSQFVKQNTDIARFGPDPETPYFRKRYLLPVPPDNSGREEILASGLHPLFRPHNHSPGLTVAPNGDVLMIIYTSYDEYEPGVSLMATRLRFGADQWDMPSPLFDFVDANDHAPMLWTDRGTIHFFWGNPELTSAYPFQWISSGDNGASWSGVKFPFFTGTIGAHSKQPINSALRDPRGTLYVSSDGDGDNSVLWGSADNGETWYDTGGRTGGRHTTFAMLNDGRILGMGGKNTDIDGYMPKSISSDGGKSWQISRTPFSTLDGNQRPSIICLQSGRLFFVSDFQRQADCFQPEGIERTGALVALSSDEGESWRIKTLPGALRHETWECDAATVGYSVARQAPNGIIHIITTMNRPNLHFALNEAWILAENTAEEKMTDAELMASSATSVSDLQEYTETYENGNVKVTYSGGIADNGRWVLHGAETWFYRDGAKKREVRYQLGEKVGEETYWGRDGAKIRAWDHQTDGTHVWTQYWSNGQRKSVSRWIDHKCHGIARTWDPAGNLISEKEFSHGKFID